MLPPGMELRPDLGESQDVLMVGFSEAGIDNAVALDILAGPLLDYAVSLAEATPVRAVVVDMRNMGSLTSTGMGKFLSLTSRLGAASWRMILVIDDPVRRSVLAETHLDRNLRIVRAEDLGRVLRTVSTSPAGGRDSEDPGAFTRGEIEEITAAGITLDDAIREVENLRT